MNEGKAARFHRLRRRNRRFAFIARVGVLVAAAGWGWPSGAVDAFLSVPALPAMVRVGLGAGMLAAMLALAMESAALPFVVRADFFLERRFGLSRQSFGDWLSEQAHATAMRVFCWSAAAVAVYAAIGVWPEAWWRMAGAGYLATTVVQAGLASGAVAAAPYPRPIPGVPRARNLSGISFAVANVTGMLARVLEGWEGPLTPEGCLETLRPARPHRA